MLLCIVKTCLEMLNNLLTVIFKISFSFQEQPPPQLHHLFERYTDASGAN